MVVCSFQSSVLLGYAPVHLTGVSMEKTGELAKGNHPARQAAQQKTGERGKKEERERGWVGGRGQRVHIPAPHMLPL